MNMPPRPPSRYAALGAVALLILLSVNMPSAAGAEIPHENYDLAGSNLDFVIALLNSSIMYSESALLAMHGEQMADVEQNLAVVRSVMQPCDQLLAEIVNTAGSYRDLRALLPPFANLSQQEDSFASMETQLIGVRDDVVSASQLANLTGNEMQQALNAISMADLLIGQMNNTINKMLASAYQIDALEVNGQHPFAYNNLVTLIENLRDLLTIINHEIDTLVKEGIPWSNNQSFLVLLIAPTHYFLGENINGGGYLFLNGSFASGRLIQVIMDGKNLTTAVTSPSGRYQFSYAIPLNSSWLGTHSLQSATYTTNATLESGSVSIQISLVPTVMRLDLSAKELSFDEKLIVNISLADYEYSPLPDAPCRLVLDGSSVSFETNSLGEHRFTLSASEIGYGTHMIQASYDGEIPYAPSSSNATSFAINIPTTIHLSLARTRVFIARNVIGNGTLFANGSAPLAGQTVTLFVDDKLAMNVTTDLSGGFTFSIAASSIGSGTHTLRASLLYKDGIWRYSQDEKGFTIYKQKTGKYPFWPFIPGWGGDITPEIIPDLFFGKYAYYTWLSVLTLTAIIVRIIQVRKGQTLAEYNVELIDRITEPVGPPAQMTLEDFAREIARESEAPSSPNERIIWYYHNLLSFLSKKRSISIRPSATHWELAGLLKSLGYPSTPVEDATFLFERALYSGTTLGQEDIVSMSMSLSSLVSAKSWGMSSAA
jgi:hypothetical protein